MIARILIAPLTLLSLVVTTTSAQAQLTDKMIDKALKSNSGSRSFNIVDPRQGTNTTYTLIPFKDKMFDGKRAEIFEQMSQRAKAIMLDRMEMILSSKFIKFLDENLKEDIAAGTIDLGSLDDIDRLADEGQLPRLMTEAEIEAQYVRYKDVTAALQERGKIENKLSKIVEAYKSAKQDHFVYDGTEKSIDSIWEDAPKWIKNAVTDALGPDFQANDLYFPSAGIVMVGGQFPKVLVNRLAAWFQKFNFIPAKFAGSMIKLIGSSHFVMTIRPWMVEEFNHVTGKVHSDWHWETKWNILVNLDGHRKVKSIAQGVRVGVGGVFGDLHQLGDLYGPAAGYSWNMGCRIGGTVNTAGLGFREATNTILKAQPLSCTNIKLGAVTNTPFFLEDDQGEGIVKNTYVVLSKQFGAVNPAKKFDGGFIFPFQKVMDLFAKSETADRKAIEKAALKGSGSGNVSANK